MKNDKLTAVYARTSTKKQDFTLQLEAAYPYLSGTESEGLYYFIDEGVSGSSKPSELLKLIELIKSDLIGTLVVYDRSRLSNNVDTYLQLINLLNEHQVDVIFTSVSDNDKLGDLYTEGRNALLKKMEGIEMSNRIKAGLKRKKAKST